MQWNGNNRIFRGYIKGKIDQNGKSRPVGKVENNLVSYSQASKFACFGGILHKDYIDISFDDVEMSKAALNFIRSQKLRCMVLENPKTGHIHTYWKKPAEITKLSQEDVKLSIGFIADIHGGNTYIRLHENGVDRFPPVYDIPPNEAYQEAPKELIPVKNYRMQLWGLKSGDGRNSALSAAAQFLFYNTEWGKDTVKRILINSNRFLFKESLSDSELNIILRDETFAEKQDIPELQTISAAQLYNMDIKPTEFIVTNLLPVGLTVLASPPKYGKSWFCLDLALSVAEGKNFLGFAAKKSNVLYLALEDTNNRLKERLTKLTGGASFPAELSLAIDSVRLDDGFINQLEKELQRQPETKLIIIDTFAKIRSGSRKNETTYAADSREAGMIKKLADNHAIAILLVTHTRKAIDHDDPLANITGTYGVTGIADDTIVLTKEKRADDLTKMSITGRDISFEEYPLIMNKTTGKWTRQSDSFDEFEKKAKIEADKAAYMISPVRKTIMRLLEENSGKWQGSCSNIISKSKEYQTPIALTSQALSKEIAEINGFLYEESILHIEIKNGKAASKHKFEKVE